MPLIDDRFQSPPNEVISDGLNQQKNPQTGSNPMLAENPFQWVHKIGNL